MLTDYCKNTLHTSFAYDKERILGRNSIIFRFQHPISFFVYQTKFVTFVVMYYAMSIVEYISFCTSDIWNVQVNNDISFGIDEFYLAVVIYRSQAIRKHPCVLVLRLDSYLTCQHIEVATSIAVTITDKRVIPQWF